MRQITFQSWKSENFSLSNEKKVGKQNQHKDLKKKVKKGNTGCAEKDHTTSTVSFRKESKIKLSLVIHRLDTPKCYSDTVFNI